LPADPKFHNRKKTKALHMIAGNIQERIDVQRDLAAASKRQRSMLPQVPKLPGYQVASIYRPAERVSGDFYDIIDLGAERFGILLGDISGHGMQAGIVMGAARKALQIYARSGQQPGQTLSWGNDDLGRELDRETFLTAAYSILETASGQMRYVRAGHTHPLLIGPQAAKWQVVKSEGMMIGITTGERFTKSLEELTIQLQPGQTFVQYTDGVIEAHERGGEEFGLEGIIKSLEQTYRPDLDLQELLDGLMRDFDKWAGSGPQEDDITILAIRRNPLSSS
jgi:serine phosphatase RsbU (regulator of sigma subunit)